jgi:hypothetical protein
MTEEPLLNILIDELNDIQYTIELLGNEEVGEDNINALLDCLRGMQRNVQSLNNFYEASLNKLKRK